MDEAHTHDDHEPEASPADPLAPEIDLSEAEGLPSNVPVDEPQVEPPAFHHTPETVYWYDEPQETQHPDLGLILPGENTFAFTEPEMVAAIEACVASGLLQPMPSEPEREQEDEPCDTPEDEPA